MAKDYHKLLVRIGRDHADYLDEVAHETGLSMSSLIRLAIQIAPHTEEWKNQVEAHARRRKHHVEIVPTWEKTEESWLTV